MNKLEIALEALNVKISRYLVSQTDTNTDVVVVGGLEVIYRYPVKDFKNVNDSWEKVNVHGSGNERVLLPFEYTNIELDAEHLTKLRKFRDMKSISKEQSLDYEVVNKDRVLNKIVYVYEESPSTNSLALAKQFQLKHFHVVEQIFKLAETNPSILMGISYGVYSLDVPIVDKVDPIECSIGSTNPTVPTSKENYGTFLHITEDVYYDFINNMGTPKSKEMKVYRRAKQQEYLKGFQVLRDHLISSGVAEEELERMIFIRTEKTKELMTTIKDYIEHYNNNSGSNKQLNYDKTSRLIFNLVNFNAGIDAKSFKLKKNDRDEKDIILQNNLANVETLVIGVLLGGKYGVAPLLDLLMTCFKMTSVEIKNILEDRGVGFLGNELF